MADFDLTKGGAVGYPAHLKGGTFRVAATVDFNESNYVATNVLQLISVPIGCRVLAVAWTVETVEGATLTFDIGDGDDPDGFVDGANGNALAQGDSDGIATGYPAPGRNYAAADTIDLLINNDASSAKITVVAFMRDGSAAE